MKNGFFASLVCICSIGCMLFCRCSGNKSPSAPVLDNSIDKTMSVPISEIIELSGKLNDLSGQMDEIPGVFEYADTDSTAASLADSIKEVNYLLTSLLLKYASSFDASDVAILKSSSVVKVMESADQRIRFYYWDMGFAYRIPHYNNVLAYYTSAKKCIVTQYGGIDSGRHTGEGFTVDTLFDVNINNRKVYLLSSSNSCGSACIYTTVTAFTIEHDILKENLEVFTLNNECYSEIDFRYIINEGIKDDLQVTLDMAKKTISVPQLDESGKDVTGELVYKIEFCGGK